MSRTQHPTFTLLTVLAAIVALRALGQWVILPMVSRSEIEVLKAVDSLGSEVHALALQQLLCIQVRFTLDEICCALREKGLIMYSAPATVCLTELGKKVAAGARTARLF